MSNFFIAISPCCILFNVFVSKNVDNIGKIDLYMVLMAGIEPTASSLPRKYSTTELHQRGGDGGI